MTISEYALKFVGRPYIWGGDDIDKVKALLSDIRSDVSFIRGRMEAPK